MSEITICDQCGNRIGLFGLHISPISGSGGDLFFLDNSWNGGDFCSVACATDKLSTVRDPEAVA